MQVGFNAVVSTAEDAAFVRDAERLGAASVWVPETWAQDALTQLGYLAGGTTSIRLGTSIVQLGARSPALFWRCRRCRMQQLSGGRFLLGIGASGPQVMEGWHGVRFDRPLAATRETDRDRPRSRARRPLSYEGGSTSCRCRAGRAGRSAQRRRHSRCRSTWRRSARATSS